MKEIGQKLQQIAAKHPLYLAHKTRVIDELEEFERKGVIKEILSKYQRVQDKPSIRGDVNILNSLVFFLLGLTSCQPDFSLPLDLNKRRTYARPGFPDVDMDFDCFKRYLIFEYAIEKYGREYVANIGTRQTMKLKMALRKVCKVLDPSNAIRFKDGKPEKDGKTEQMIFENSLLKTLPDFMKDAEGNEIKKVSEAVKMFADFRRYMDHYPQVYKVVERLQGRVAGLGCHAGGLVLSSMPLARIAPLCITKGEDAGDSEGERKQTIATQFAMKDVEAMGLIKIDILGLSTKSAIAECMRLIRQNYGEDTARRIDLSNLSLNDTLTLDLLKTGHTDGCFQLEGGGMKRALTMVVPDSVDDLMAIIALYRPGPKQYIPEYAARKHGQKKVSYVHPLMESITRNTYGILVYQEQILQAFVALADQSISDGYRFLKTCAKKDPVALQKFKEPFFAGALHKGIRKEIIERIWSDLEKFGLYAFNMAHSGSYAYESYKTAFLKAHYPVEFMCARMTVENMRKKYDDVLRFEEDCIRNLGIRILPVDLNESKVVYTIVGEKTIRRPLVVKDVGQKAAEAIVAHQPYGTDDVLRDFCMRAGKEIDTKSLEALWGHGIFGQYKKDELLKNFEMLKQCKKDEKKRPQGRFFR